MSEPCSCIRYSPEFVLIGTDVIYKLNINTGSIRPFLAAGTKSNTDYNSLPIDILVVSEPNASKPEFLCCFTGNDYGNIWATPLEF